MQVMTISHKGSEYRFRQTVLNFIYDIYLKKDTGEELVGSLKIAGQLLFAIELSESMRLLKPLGTYAQQLGMVGTHDFEHAAKILHNYLTTEA